MTKNDLKTKYSIVKKGVAAVAQCLIYTRAATVRQVSLNRGLYRRYMQSLWAEMSIELHLDSGA